MFSSFRVFPFLQVCLLARCESRDFCTVNLRKYTAAMHFRMLQLLIYLH